MKNVVKHIITGTLMLLALWSTSCSHETEVFGISEKETALSIGFRLPTRSPETGEGYEDRRNVAFGYLQCRLGAVR